MSKTFRKYELESIGSRFDRGLHRLGYVQEGDDQRTPEYEHIYKVRRLIGRQDVIRINALVRTALQGIENPADESFEKARNMGVSLASPSCLRKVYVKHYHDPQYGSLMHGRFNRKIEQYVDSINSANPFLFPQLGQIGIFGAAEDKEGPKFIGPALIGQDVPQIKIESKGLLYRLTDNEEWYTETYGRNLQPHISMVRTDSYEKAEEIRAALTESDLTGIYVQLLPAEVNRSNPS
jgi:hypothetical protein